jgi:predicted dehydrogenase
MNKARIGLIGAGWWVTVNHIPILKARDDVELAGVCRLGKELLLTIQKDADIPFGTEDYRELLELDLDGVVVGSPHYLHYEHALAALEKGFHVMCEKPMTLRAHEAWHLVETAKAKDLHLLIPYGWHYKPFIQRAKQLMDRGVVGEIEHVTCQMSSPTKGFLAGGGRPPSRWEPTLAEPDPATWQVKENGGGYAHSQLTHATALLFWLTPLRAQEVSCRMGSHNSNVDMYNAASVMFENGATGAFSGAATLPDDDKFQIEIRVFGSEGVLILDVERERLEVRRHDRHHVLVDVPPGQGAYSCETPPARFIDLIHGHGVNESPGEVAARSVELLSAMFDSHAHGGVPTRVYRAE